MSRFYVEAKRASADIYNEDFAKQAINYAFNKGVAWAVLTNFRQLVVFPAFAQVPRQGVPLRVLDLTFEDYVKPDSGIELLSKEAVTADRLRERAERTGVRARSVELQKELYDSMRGWRETLINQVARVMGYSLEDIHHAEEAVQKLLNRLIFLRNCEDRNISEDRLRALLNQWRANRSLVHLSDRLSQLFARAAQTYNSELFTTDALIDLLLPRLGTTIDDALGQVLIGLYEPPNSYAEYNFKFIGSDVLGAMYEQYLGHVAARSKELAADRERQLSLGIAVSTYQIESRRQRRKEQGIYYTPKWIVDYIIQQTVGRWLQEHGHDSDALERVAVLDPACGSGSFLIRAYETLLEHEADRTNQTVEMLSRQEREHILRQNIYGVDLDPQAVEIARLNLLLRMVREEEQLPPLRDNVLQGNSLISGTDTELLPFFGDAWASKRPLNWNATFKGAMEQGGFDIIIGNPPYVGFHGFEDERNYFRNFYETASGRFDLYIPFIERSLQLLKDNGYLGFICPSNFMKREHGRKLRDLLKDTTTLLELVDFEHSQIFQGAINYTCLLILKKGKGPRTSFNYYKGSTDSVPEQIRQEDLINRGWVFVPSHSKALVDKVFSQNIRPLGDLVEGIHEGIVTGANSVFLISINDTLAIRLEPSLTSRVLKFPISPRNSHHARHGFREVSVFGDHLSTAC